MRCPICNKPVEAPNDPNSKTPYPFCSERCKLIDLGRWLSDKYQIPVRNKEEETDQPAPETNDPNAD
jgi:hypothetical protein